MSGSKKVSDQGMINLFGYAGPDQEPKNPCSKSLIFMKMRSTGIRVVGVRILLFCAVNLQGVRCSSYDVIKALGWGFLMNLTASLNSNCEF